MIIPKVENSKVINSSIVFNDSVLNLKEENQKLKLSTIENISEYSLETCIQTILEYNLDVTFHTIQYSKQKQKVYFYADKIISKDGWKYINNFQYTPLQNEKEVLEEIKRLLSSEKSKSKNHTSLYEVKTLHKEEMENFCQKIEHYETKLNEAFKNKLQKDMYPQLSLPYYNENTITLCFRPSKYAQNFRILFSKKNNNLYVKKSEYEKYNFEIIDAAGKIISEAYDELIKFSHSINENEFKTKPINSNFKIKFYKESVQIIAQTEYNFFSSDIIFALSHVTPRYTYNKKGYTYENCSSNDLVDLLKNNEDELFKSIFIRIEDCPKWMQEELFCRRQNELTEERRTAEEKTDKKKKLSFRKRMSFF